MPNKKNINFSRQMKKNHFQQTTTSYETERVIKLFDAVYV